MLEQRIATPTDRMRWIESKVVQEDTEGENKEAVEGIIIPSSDLVSQPPSLSLSTVRPPPPDIRSLPNSSLKESTLLKVSNLITSPPLLLSLGARILRGDNNDNNDNTSGMVETAESMDSQFVPSHSYVPPSPFPSFFFEKE